MKKLLTLLLTGLWAASFAQVPKDYSVSIEATVNASVPEIRLDWNGDANATSWKIYRKSVDSTNWGSVRQTNPGIVPLYIDRSIQKGVKYEYKIEKVTANYTAEGYITAGIEIPAVEDRGKIILIADLAYSSLLVNELEMLRNDLAGDGWHVIQKLVHNAAAITDVKNTISTEYNKDPQNVKAVYLFGNLAVAYSGLFAHDGQTVDHDGAYPTDAYYSDINGVWTDLQYASSWFSNPPQPPRTRNIRGDGKFDQDLIPSAAELQVGRVDFSQLSLFSMNEWQLMQDYVHRSHDYRHKKFTVTQRAIVDDTVGISLNDAVSKTAYQNFGPMFGNSGITQGDYVNHLRSGSYSWGYANGTGTFTSLSTIGSTGDLASDSLNAIFHMLNGAYFGDWDIANNFMRAIIANGQGLASLWSGTPFWQLHPMGLGETIGYCTWLTQNNNGVYEAGQQERATHIALMGDPTLRLHVVGPAANLSATNAVQNHVDLSWSASADNVLGYHLYRKKKYETGWGRLNVDPITATTYTDSCVIDSGDYVYMLRALKLEVSKSGSYYNLSQGIFDSLTLTSAIHVNAGFTSLVNGATAHLTNTSTTNNLIWDFGDGNTSTDVDPAHVYNKNGTYTIRQIAINSCNSDTIYKTVDIDYYRPDGPTNLFVTDLGANYYNITWDASPDFVNGYNVYRRTHPTGFFQILTTFGFHTTTSFPDSCLQTPGDYEYMVTAYKRDTFATGIKVNFSDTIFEVLNVTNDYSVKSDFSYVQKGDTLFLTNQSLYADSFLWDLDDGFTSSNENPYRTVGQNGPLRIELFVVGPCGNDVSVQNFNFTTVGLDEKGDKLVRFYPNPTGDVVHFELGESGPWQLTIFAMDGKKVLEKEVLERITNVDVGHLSPGTYQVHLTSGSKQVVEKLSIE